MSSPPTRRSSWSIPVAVISGIPVYIHVTFLIFLVWVAFWSRPNALASVTFVLALFGCVLLHEFGHAMAARKFGVKTSSITLYPIGGIAIIEDRPKPKPEFWIAIAGPAVNFFIAICLTIGIIIKSGRLPDLKLAMPQESFVTSLLIANLLLGGFNLLPALPMDGGRILRALLAMSVGEDRGTRAAAIVGQIIAGLLLLFGLMAQDVLLMLVAFFVFFGASQEASSNVLHTLITNHRVSEAMLTGFTTLESGATLEAAAQALLDGSQQDFPVTVGDQIIGVLTRTAIATGIARGASNDYVAGHMIRDFEFTTPGDLLEPQMEKLNSNPTPILVMSEDKLVGMLTRENLSEFIMLEHARARSKRIPGPL